MQFDEFAVSEAAFASGQSGFYFLWKERIMKGVISKKSVLVNVVNFFERNRIMKRVKREIGFNSVLGIFFNERKNVMKNVIVGAVVVMVAVFAGSSQAALSVYEDFSNATASGDMNGVTTGMGLSGTWSAYSDYDIIVTPSAIDYPSNVTFTQSDSDRVHFGWSWGTNTAVAGLSSSIDFGADGEFFISYLGTTFDSSNCFATVGLSDGTNGVTVGHSYNAPFIINPNRGHDVTGAAIGNDSTAIGEEIFYVARFVTKQTGYDEVYLKAYNSSSDTVHGDYSDLSGTGSGADQWDVSLTIDSDASMNELVINLKGGSGSMDVDEIRIGATWEDVTSLPEPATIGLLGLGLGLLWRRK